MTLEAAIEAEAQAQAICMQHPDFRTAFDAWKEKRPFRSRRRSARVPNVGFLHRAPVRRHRSRDPASFLSMQGMQRLRDDLTARVSVRSDWSFHGAADAVDRLTRLGVPSLLGALHRRQRAVAWLCIARELLAYRSPMADAIFAVQGLASHPLLLTGSDRWAARLDDVVHGRAVGGFALTEPEAGSDVASMRAVARRGGRRHLARVDGEKTFISNVGIARFFVVFANGDPRPLGKKRNQRVPGRGQRPRSHAGAHRDDRRSPARPTDSARGPRGTRWRGGAGHAAGARYPRHVSHFGGSRRGRHGAASLGRGGHPREEARSVRQDAGRVPARASRVGKKRWRRTSKPHTASWRGQRGPKTPGKLARRKWPWPRCSPRKPRSGSSTAPCNCSVASASSPGVRSSSSTGACAPFASTRGPLKSKAPHRQRAGRG